MLHPLYDRARAGLRKIFPSLINANNEQQEGSTITGRGRGHGVRHAHPDSPGFWSLKLRVIAAAESWMSSTAGRTVSRGRSGARASTRGTEGRTRVSFDNGTAVVVHDEGDVGRQNNPGHMGDVTVSVDQVTDLELPDLERGPGRVGGHDPRPSSGEHAAVVGQK